MTDIHEFSYVSSAVKLHKEFGEFLAYMHLVESIFEMRQVDGTVLYSDGNLITHTFGKEADVASAFQDMCKTGFQKAEIEMIRGKLRDKQANFGIQWACRIDTTEWYSETELRKCLNNTGESKSSVYKTLMRTFWQRKTSLI